MYDVLLVDDEPLILSGIKFLVDWEKNDCRVADTSRNGADALEKIRALHPDIVLCDINMPRVSGMELLRAVSEEQPNVVFVMLTNLQDFDLAQTALRHRAVDYILKSQLEAEALKASLARAKAECENRWRLARAKRDERYERLSVAEQLRGLFLHAAGGSLSGPVSEELRALLEKPYAAACILTDYACVPNHDQLTQDDFRDRFAWQKELCEKLLQNHFRSFSLFASGEQDCLILFCWDVEESGFRAALRRFYQKLAAASVNITQVSPVALGSNVFSGAARLDACRAEMAALRTRYYNFPESALLFAGDGADVPVRALNLNGLALKLGEELRARSLPGCEALLARAAETVGSVPHSRESGVLLCHELFNTASDALGAALGAGARLPAFFTDADGAHARIDRLLTRAQVAAWLECLRGCVLSAAREIAPPHPDFLEKAKEYVSGHLTERIMLSDVASHVNVSPSYLSSVFKKTHHQNFIDYINSRKMELACSMIRENQYRIYEICYQLGYENPYYFTRTFRRHIGMTPSEYQARQRGVPAPTAGSAAPAGPAEPARGK